MSATRADGRSLVRRSLSRTPAARPVFRDGGGRWKRLRAAGLAVLIALVAAAAFCVPRMLAPPALDGEPIPDGPSATAVGRPPVVGDGPLVRVVRLVTERGSTYGEDPFTGDVVTTLTDEDEEDASGAEYAIERYGYYH